MSSDIRIFINPFKRPWMGENGAASSATPAAGSKALRGIVAGGITGCIEVCITYPTEYIKTQLQLDGKDGQKQYSGIIDCAKKTVKKDGFFGLYRGLSVLIYGSIPKAAVRFGSFETLKSYMVDENNNLSPAGRLTCGLLAGCCEAIFAVIPMETIKVKFINDRRSANPQYKGFIDGVRKIVKAEGYSGLYKGPIPTIMRQGSNQAIRFFVMETLKDMYRAGDPNKTLPTPVTGAFGAFAGACSVFGNTPIDVVKTRMQGFDAHKYKNTVDCFFKILKNEGPAALYKGTVPRLIRACCDVAITFMLYDNIMLVFNKVWP